MELMCRRRDYPPNKINENITAEIMMTCLTETRESYPAEIIVELKSEGEDGEVEENVKRIQDWAKQWREDELAGKHEEE